jgi:flagellar biosynthetic protein FliR
LLHEISFDADQITGMVARLWWPLLRVGGFVLTAPVIGSSIVPRSARIAFSVAFAFLLAPVVAVPANLSIFSGAGTLASVNQILIGISIGLVVQLIFDALALAGQTVSMTMGLGYATLVDPQRGANTAVLGQMFTIFGTLIYLSLNGHLALLGSFVRSFDSMPVGAEILGRNFFGSIAGWGAHVFESGLLIALPATIALIIVNLALGVVTRAAPQLNLFGVGFPVTMLAGFFVLIVGLDSVVSGIEELVASGLNSAAELASGTVSGSR